MKATRGLIVWVACVTFFSGVAVFVGGTYLYADAGPATCSSKSGQAESYEGYLDELERETSRLEAEKGLRVLELSLYEEILRKQAELRRIKRELSAARRASSQAAKPLVQEAVVRPRAEVVPREEVEKEFVSIFPEGMSPGKGQVLTAAVRLKRGEVKEIRVLDEDADSIYAELPLGRISIRKSEIETIKPHLLPEEEYRFKLGDYYDNVLASRWYYLAIAQYNRVLDINPNNKRAQEKLEKCREELDGILERERKQRYGVPKRALHAIEPERSEPIVPEARARHDLSRQVPSPLEVLHYRLAMMADRCAAPRPGRFGRARMFGPVPPYIPLDVNRSILLVPIL